MSEIDDLLAIAGAIDQTVLLEGDDQRQVANLLPTYRVDDTPGWYGEFQETVNSEDLPSIEQLEDRRSRVNTVGDAITNLEEPTRFASMLPRRVLAIAVVTRMFPDRFGPNGEDREVVLNALMVPGIMTGLRPVPTPPPDEPPPRPNREEQGLRARALRFLTVLADPEEFERLEDWHETLRRHPDLVSPQLAGLPSPCATSVIEQSTPGGTVALIQTEHCVGGVDLQTLANRFLDPSHWRSCSSWWCEMRVAPPVAPGLMRYLEVVAYTCFHPWLKVAVFLDFARVIDHPKRKVITYNISISQVGFDGHEANGAVDVDRGVIEVRQDPGHVHVSTSKRVRFTRGMSGRVVAGLTCSVGYYDVATEMICNCSGGQPVTVGCDVGPFTDALHRFVDLAYRCVEEAGQEARRFTDRLGSRAYSPERAASDATSVMTLAMRGWGKLAITFFEAMGDLARPPAQSSLVGPRRDAGPFSFDPALAAECSLSLDEPMRSPYGDQIDTSRVAISPSELGQGGREFRLAVDVRRLEGSAYLGQVVAKDKTTGAEVTRVEVDVIVP